MRFALNAVLAVLIAASLAGCGISKEQFAAKEAEASKYRKAFDGETDRALSLTRKVDELNALNVDLESRLELARAEITRLGGDKAMLEQTAATAEARAAAAQAKAAAAEARATTLEAKSAQYAQLAGSLQSQIQAGQVEISELRGKMTVKLKDKILFASGSARLGKDGRVALDAVAEAFKSLEGKNVLVAGFTDDVPVSKAGAFADNWDLSTARAASVVRYLQAKGVPPEMLGAGGFSQYRPVAANDSAANRSLNRRIEIALTAADYVPPVVDAPR